MSTVNLSVDQRNAVKRERACRRRVNALASPIETPGVRETTAGESFRVEKFPLLEAIKKLRV